MVELLTNDELDLDEEKKRLKPQSEAIGTPIQFGNVAPTGTPSAEAIGQPIGQPPAPAAQPNPSAAIGKPIGAMPETTNSPVGAQMQPPSDAVGTPISMHQPAQPHPRPLYDAYQQQVNNKAGVQNVPGFGGKVLQGLDIAGSALFPGQMALIPGTRLHHIADINRAATAAGNESAEIGSQESEQMHNAQTEEAQARTAQENARTQAIQNPQVPPKEESWTAVPGVVGTGGKVLQEEKNSGQIRWAPGIEGAGPMKGTEDKPTEAADDAKYESIVQKHLLKQPTTPEEDAFMQAYKQRKTLVPATTFNMNQPTRNDARSDKSFQYNNGALDKVAAPIDQINQRMGRLQDSLNQNTPQADALIGPELLSVMSGGQGSGLRMNEAEISRIVGGRSNWEGLKAAINQWSTDPSKANSITRTQRQQIRALAKTVQDKLIAKEQIIDESRQALIDSDDPKEHRSIVAETKKKLDAIDSGGNEGMGGPGANRVNNSTSPAAKSGLSFADWNKQRQGRQ